MEGRLVKWVQYYFLDLYPHGHDPQIHWVFSGQFYESNIAGMAIALSNMESCLPEKSVRCGRPYLVEIEENLGGDSASEVFCSIISV